MHQLNTKITHSHSYIESYMSLGLSRDKLLFTEFLPKGYRMTTLSCVPLASFEECIDIKILLGLLITLCDDFSEHPNFISKTWVNEFKLNIHLINMKQAIKIYNEFDNTSLTALELAIEVYSVILEYLSSICPCPNFMETFQFDFEEFIQCLNYSVLVSDKPFLACGIEYRHYTPHNMGMIMAGMIDIMHTKKMTLDELPSIRHILYLAQRFGHICNTLSTLKREQEEGCHNNEISLQVLQQQKDESLYLSKLTQEQESILDKLSQISIQIFSMNDYIQGLKKLKKLHQISESYI